MTTPKVHMALIDGPRRFTCGSRGRNGTSTYEQVTCNRCRQLLGIGETWAQSHGRKLPHTPRALIGKGFLSHYRVPTQHIGKLSRKPPMPVTVAAQRANRDYYKANPNGPKYDRALDSLIGRAFIHTEKELTSALVEAEKALAESLKCKDPGEIIAELSGALRRLVDLLSSRPS